jgi:hypothetical protein
MKTYWGIGGIAPCILNLHTRRKRVVSLMLQLLYPHRGNSLHPFDRRVSGWVVSSANLDAVVKKKKSLPLLGIEI